MILFQLAAKDINIPDVGLITAQPYIDIIDINNTYWLH